MYYKKMSETASRRSPAGQGAILLCAVLWSTSGLFIKVVDWLPVVIAGSRSLLAAAFLFFARRITQKSEPKPKSILLLIAGGVNYAATMLIFVIANKLTSPANAILLQYTAPVWAALLGWFFLREKPHWEHWGALVLVGAGMLLFFRNSLGGGSLTGDCLALLSGVTFAANTVFLRKAKDQNPADIVLLSNVLVALASVPFFFIYPPSPGAVNFFGVSFMGIFQIGAASALFAYGIQRVSAVQAMLTAMIEPVLNPVWVFVVTGERPSFSAISGGSIIILAVLGSSLISWRRNRS
jgi:drug/metabolite transporter (DMT)-like permease